MKSSTEFLAYLQRSIPVCMITVISLLSTACIDIVQYFELKDNQSLDIILRITSPIMDNEKKRSDVEDKIEKHRDEYDLREWGITPVNKKITTPYSNGVETTFTVKNLNLLARNSPGKPFPIIPKYDRHGQFVFMYENKKKEKDNDAEFTAAFLMSAHYTMIFGGKLKPHKAVLVEGKTLTHTELPIYSFGPLLFLDIPLYLVFSENCAVVISFTDKIHLDESVTSLEKRRAALKAEQEKEEMEKREQQEKDNKERLQEDSRDRPDNSDDFPDNDGTDSEW